MRNYGIDILRGIAIGVVMLMHFWIVTSSLNWGFPKELGNELTANAIYGVTAFFVISGYLITSHTLNRYGSLEKVDITQFYWMRCSRIAPLMLAVMAVNIMLLSYNVPEFRMPKGMYVFKPVFAALTFTFNKFRDHYGTVNLPWDVFWSLSVEEMFYLLFPVFCLAAGRKALMWLSIVFFYGIAYRGIYHILTDNGSSFDAIAAGCFVAVVLKKYSIPLKFRPYLLAFGCVGLCITYFFIPHMSSAFSPTSLIVSVCFIIAAFALKPVGNICSILSAPIRFLGRLSYEVYLIHCIVICFVVGLLSRHVTFETMITSVGNIEPVHQMLCIYLIVTISMSYLTSKYFTNPMNKYLRTLVSGN